jgi:hypothetical protein
MKNPGRGGPGQGDDQQIKRRSPCTGSPDSRQIDLRASLLLRASARFHLVREGAMSLDEAFDDQFICDILEATGACSCFHHINQNFDRAARQFREETPSTLEAVVIALRP